MHAPGAACRAVTSCSTAALNPTHRLIDQFAEAPVHHGVKSRAEADAKDLYRRLQLPYPEQIG